jgi:hypothetical protein
MTSAPGLYVETHCCLCEKPITPAQALVSGGGVQVMALGTRAHVACYRARYHEPAPVERVEVQQAVMELVEAK